ncbi:MAG: methionyl-tRNA formyltransferase [Anaerolineales bacterium]|nr:methionyl-tRNA formyltransferase [Anaerolineales bacterium]MDW8445998.1 methionyl-tRNA formyltransferase [Anaerolineales bacterium]
MFPRIVFMGSPNFAVPILQRLAEQYNVVGVVTQPDRPAGRGRTLTAPPVKELAVKLGIPFIQPQRLSEPSAMSQLEQWRPDLIVVAAFGQILKPPVLNLPPYGCVNVHASLLPRWRGAAPIPYAILHGDQETGITIMKMDEGVDTGPILSQRAVPILDTDNTLSLTIRLAEIAAELLPETLADYLTGKLTPREQDHKQATYAPMLKKEQGELDFSQSAVSLWRKVRAFYPWPSAFTFLNGKHLIIHEALPIAFEHEYPVGQTLCFQKKAAVATAEGLLELVKVQPSGKKPISGPDLINGYREWGRIVLPHWEESTRSG